MNYDNAYVHLGPLSEGAAERGPYDVILVQGGVETVPENVLGQLKSGGRIACLFMNGNLGDVRIGLKTETRVTWRSAFNAGAPILKGFERDRAFQL